MKESYNRYISILLLLFFTVLLYIGSINFVKNSINDVIESDGESITEYIYEEFVDSLENYISSRGNFINNQLLGVESERDIVNKLQHLGGSVRYRLYNKNLEVIQSSRVYEGVETLTLDKLFITRPILNARNELKIEYLFSISVPGDNYYLLLYFENTTNSFLRVDRVPPHMHVRLIHKSGLQLHPPLESEHRRPRKPDESLEDNHLPPPPRDQQMHPPSGGPSNSDVKPSEWRGITYTQDVSIIDATLLIDYSIDDAFRTYRPILWIFRITILLSFLIFLSVTIFINGGRLRAFDYNSLTHLPGNRSIIRQIERRIRSKSDYMIIYCDLDNFKAFNDVYGFSAGDKVILFSAKLLKQVFSKVTGVFIGHIGGDDFVIIGEREQLKNQAEKFGMEFDKKISDFYNDHDRDRGYISTKDRMGEWCEFPLISMSMGGLELKKYSSVHYLKIAEICAEVKKEAKKQQGSTLYIDKRGDIPLD